MINAPRQVKFYAPTSLRNFDFLNEPTIEGATAESYMNDDIADGGQALNLMDAKVRRFVTAFDNLLTNPQFKTDSDYVKGTGWTIDAGKPGLAVFLETGSGGDLSQASVVTSSNDYIVIVKCSEYTSGNYTPKLGTASDGSIVSTGITIHEITANGTGFLFDGPAVGDAKFEYVYVLDANDYRFDLVLNSAKDMNFVIVDGQNLLDVFPASLFRSIKLYHHTSDSFGAATEIVPSERISGLLNRQRPFTRYNGINSKVAVPDNDNLDGFINFSVSVWAKNNLATTISTSVMCGKYTVAANQRSWLFELNNVGKFVVVTSPDGINVEVETSDDVIVANVWHHYACVFTGIGMTLYIDGVAIASTTSGAYTGSIFNSSAEFMIGNYTDSGPWDGDIGKDGILIHNRALAPKEIGQMALGVPVSKPLMISDGWLNRTFDTFIVDGINITQAVGSAALDNCYFIIEALDINHKYLLTFENTDSGTLNDVGVIVAPSDTLNSGQLIIAPENMLQGVNSVQFTPTNAWTYIGFRQQSSGAPDFAIANLYLTDLDTLISFPLLVDQWGKQAVYVSDFSVDVDGWARNSGDANFVLTGNVDGIQGQNDTLRCAASGGDVAMQILKNDAAIIPDDPYITTFDYIVDAGSGLANLGLGSTGARVGLDNITIVEGTWQTGQTLVGDAPAAGIRFAAFTTPTGSTTDTLLDGKKIYFKNVVTSRLGCVAAYQHDGISKEQAKLLDGSSNKLSGVMTNVEVVDGPDSDNLGFYMMEFDTIRNSLYWFLSINEDNDLPIALQKFGQWFQGKSYLFNITIADQYGGAIDYPGVDLIETESGLFDATKRYGNRDTFIIPIAFQSDDGWKELQEFLAVLGGMELPFYMKVLPLNLSEDRIVYRLRLTDSETPFKYLFGSGVPWRVGLSVMVDL